MRRIRFNIASLLVVVLLLAVGFAALRESNDLWESGVFTLTLGVLLISILLAVHRTESRRAFWMGFALFGSGYVGLSLIPSIESRLITTKALAYLDSKVPGRTQSFYTIRFTGTGSNHNSIQTQAGTVKLWDATTGRLARWLERHDRELRQDRTLAVRFAGGLARRASLPSSLASFQIGTSNQRRSILEGTTP